VEEVKDLVNDQAFLVMFPIVAMGILAGVAGAYFAWRERREEAAANKRD
jgi:hypothetical protein